MGWKKCMFNKNESQQVSASNNLQHLAPDELVDVLTAARQCSIRDWALFLVGYVHGLRASEAVNLRLGDIDWQAETLTVTRLKGSLKTTQAVERHRGRPLLSEYRALKEWLKVRKADGSDFLFVSQKGGALRPETATHLFFKYCKMASEGRIARGERPIARSCWNFKILKHSCGTHMADGNANPYRIKMQLGHRSFNSTMVYLHGDQKLASEEAQRIRMQIF
jgi:type 1 fimbriae regulatory protein FimB